MTKNHQVIIHDKKCYRCGRDIKRASASYPIELVAKGQTYLRHIKLCKYCNKNVTFSPSGDIVPRSSRSFRK